MANKPISMSRLRQVLKLYFKGKSKLQISTFTGLSRTTVIKYLNVLQTLSITQEEVSALDDASLDKRFCLVPAEPVSVPVQKLFDYFDEHEKKLRRRGMTMKKLYDEYASLHGDGYRASSFYKYHKAWKRRHSPDMHIEHKVGDKMYIDFTGDKLPYIESETGAFRQAEVFIAILGSSQLTYIEATRTQTLQDFITACQHALRYFGGAPLAVVSDNLKSAVTKSSKYEPTLNENFELFANHYNMAVLPARPRKPKDKPLVEGMVKISYSKVFVELPEAPTFTFKQLNEQISVLLHKLNTTNFSRRTYSRLDQFNASERGELQPLPDEHYEFRLCRHATVTKYGHVCLTADRHYYSVPYQYIGKRTRILYTSSHVEVFHRYERIAIHERSRMPQGFTTEAAHLASHHKAVTEWSPEYFIARAGNIGSVVQEYITIVLQKKQHPEQAYRTCRGILSFERRVGVQRLINACKRAHSLQAYSYRTIEDILRKGLDRLDADEQQHEMPMHENIRGKDYYGQIDSLSQTEGDGR